VRDNEALGKAFLDLALVGIVISTIGVAVGLVRGDGVGPGWVLAALAIYAAYFVGAVRLGVSPIQYVRNLAKRGSLLRKP
jgi:Na+/H+-dicarboxylate symporter